MQYCLWCVVCQGTVCRSGFSHTKIWIQRIELKPSGLAASIFKHQVSSYLPSDQFLLNGLYQKNGETYFCLVLFLAFCPSGP